MGKSLDSITDQVREFIEAQHMFFVGSAPLTETGHVNISPKGTDTFRILGPNQVAYLDMTGSGNETSAHLLENGRITLMFCAFDGPPNIVRLFGTGHTVVPGQPGWDDLARHFDVKLGARQIIVADIALVRTSCGHGVPYYEWTGDREFMADFAEAKGEEGLDKYWREKNMVSLDGLPTPMSEAMAEKR